jgi:excisionase family DNA binding protein
MAKQQIDYSTWLTKQQAADAIGVSQKGIERLAKARKLQQYLWRRPSGGQPIKVYAPDDVERLAHQKQPEKEFLVPPAAAGTNGHAELAPVGKTMNAQAFLAALISTIQQAAETQSRHVETLFLTIPEAAQYTGLSQAFIRRQCQSGELIAIKDGGWKIHRTRLEALGQ